MFVQISFLRLLNLQLFVKLESRKIKGGYIKNCDNKHLNSPCNNFLIKYFELQENSCANTTIRIPLQTIFSNGTSCILILVCPSLKIVQVLIKIIQVRDRISTQFVIQLYCNKMQSTMHEFKHEDDSLFCVYSD